MKYIKSDASIEYTGTLEENKTQAIEQIVRDFNSIAETNTCDVSLGFRIDNRWALKNDVDNANCVLDVWFPTGQQTVYYRDSNNVTHALTEPQLIQVKTEAQANRLYHLSLKWRREELVLQSTAIPQIWEFVEAPASVIDELIPFIPT